MRRAVVVVVAVVASRAHILKEKAIRCVLCTHHDAADVVGTTCVESVCVECVECGDSLFEIIV